MPRNTPSPVYTPNAGNTVGLCFICLIFPMISVYFVRGFHADLLINFILWLFGMLPGMIHGWYIVIKYANPKPKSTPTGKYDISASRHAPSPTPFTETPQAPPPPQAQTTSPMRDDQSAHRPEVHPFLAGTTHPSTYGSSTVVSPMGPHDGGYEGHGAGQGGGLPVYEEVDGSQMKQVEYRGDSKRQ